MSSTDETYASEVPVTIVTPHNYKDIAWKSAIGHGLPDLIQIILPKTYSQLDFTKLAKHATDETLLVPESVSDTGKRIVDLVFEIPMLDKAKPKLVLMIEQQDYEDPLFAERFYDCVIRLEAREPKKLVEAAVIYTGKALNQTSFRKVKESGLILVEFKSFHVPSYSLEELRTDPRPFFRIFQAARLAEELTKTTEEEAILEAQDKAAEVFTTMRNLGRRSSGEWIYTDVQRNNTCTFTRRILKINKFNVCPDFLEEYKTEMVNFTVYDEILQQERIAGLMEGEIKGEIRGEIKGEIKAKEDVALEMLNDDLSVERVARLTKLSVDTIRSIDEARKCRQNNP
jgi:hypothetical protein